MLIENMQHKYQLCVQRENDMWGLYALEDIPAHVYICSYLGELVSEKIANFRERFTQQKGMSYTLGCYNPEDPKGRKRKRTLLPFVIDATFYGNESRFINHSCSPNLKIQHTQTDSLSDYVNKAFIFSAKEIKKGEQLTMDYGWDCDLTDVPEDVPCKCGSARCRKLLLIAHGIDRRNAREEDFYPDHWELIKK